MMRGLVSQNKLRYKMDGFDLDLRSTINQINQTKLPQFRYNNNHINVARTNMYIHRNDYRPVRVYNNKNIIMASTDMYIYRHICRFIIFKTIRQNVYSSKYTEQVL
jgi:hypothetical protein